MLIYVTIERVCVREKERRVGGGTERERESMCEIREEGKNRRGGGEGVERERLTGRKRKVQKHIHRQRQKEKEKE